MGDLILFIHVVPFMAAVALRPHQSEERKLYLSTLNFLMLLVWWVFLYAFIVFPDEYVVLNVALYSPHFDLLYLVENLAMLGVLGILAWKARDAWKEIYWNLFIASGLYTTSSMVTNAAIARGQYHTGSVYDIPFIASICWMIWAALLARKSKPACESAAAEQSPLADACPATRHARHAFSSRDGILGVVSRPGCGDHGSSGCWSRSQPCWCSACSYFFANI